MQVMNDQEIIMELLDISQQFTELFQEYGLQPPRPLIERLVSITKTIREDVSKNEQAIIENQDKKA